MKKKVKTAPRRRAARRRVGARGGTESGGLSKEASLSRVEASPSGRGDGVVYPIRLAIPGGEAGATKRRSDTRSVRTAADGGDVRLPRDVQTGQQGSAGQHGREPTGYN